MKNRWFSALLLASSLAFTVTAHARGGSGGSGVMFTLNGFYNTDKTQTQSGGATTTSDTKGAVYDVKLGYLEGDGWYLGGMYTSRSHDAGGSSTAGSATAGSIGYVGSMGFYAMAHYIFSATEGTNYKQGSGYQGDLGYLTAINGSFIVGVEVTYRTITYKKDENNAALDHYTHDEVMPMLTLGYLF